MFRRLIDSPVDLALALLCFIIASSALALGAQHATVLVFCSMILLAAVLLALSVPPTGRVPMPVWGLLALAGYTLLQALPLPARALAGVAPSNAEVWARALSPLHQTGPSYVPVSLDPGATLLEVLKWLTYAGVYWLAAELGRQRRMPWLLSGIFLSAVLVSGVTLAHGLLGLSRVYGAYTPRSAPMPWHVGPLLNPNNLAGYLNLAAFCGLGLLASRRSPLAPWITGLGVATLLACSALAGSRGGLVALVLGMSALAVSLWLGQQERHALSRGRIWSLCAIGGGLLFAGLSFQSSAWHELAERDLSKLQMVSWAKPMLQAHPWLGVGRGAFDSAFPAFHAAPENLRWQYAENFPVQWATEWGLPIAVLAVLTFGLALSPGHLGVRRSRLALGAWLGAVVLLLQNLADLGLEIPALSIALVAVLGALWGDREERLRETQPKPSGPSLPTRAVGALAVTVLAALALTRGSPTNAEERALLHAELGGVNLKSLSSVRAYQERLRAAMLRHPAEPYFPLLGGLAALNSTEIDALPWLARSLTRSRGNGQAHLALAQVLAQRGARQQALLELRLAVEQYGALTTTAARSAVRYAKTPAELRQAVPSGRIGAAMMTEIAITLRDEDRALRRSLLENAVSRDPDDARARALLVQDLLRELPRANDRSALIASIEHQLAKLRAVDPNNSAPLTLRAELLVALDRAVEAERLLATQCGAVIDRYNCLAARATIAANIPGAAAFTQAAQELSAAGCASPAECAATSTRLAELHASRREWGLALNQALRACQAEPTQATHWLRAARFAKQAGLHGDASEALRRAYNLGAPRDSTLEQRL
ncbi:MAG: O-antigen ligase family protein [Myxococcota bacterium]